LPDSNKQYPVPIERVREIREMNVRGQRPEELGAVELSPVKAEEKEMANVELVGQISLRSLERTSRRRKDKEREQQSRGNNRPKPGNQPQFGRNKPENRNGNPQARPNAGRQGPPPRGNKDVSKKPPPKN